jgi:hypothetical protein
MGNDGFKFIAGVIASIASIAFWVFMAGIVESDIGALFGMVLAFGLAMILGPLLVLGPIGPLAGFAIVAVYISAIRKKASDWGPLVAIHLVGFIVFAVRSIQSLDRAWP